MNKTITPLAIILLFISFSVFSQPNKFLNEVKSLKSTYQSYENSDDIKFAKIYQKELKDLQRKLTTFNAKSKNLEILIDLIFIEIWEENLKIEKFLIKNDNKVVWHNQQFFRKIKTGVKFLSKIKSQNDSETLFLQVIGDVNKKKHGDLLEYFFGTSDTAQYFDYFENKINNLIGIYDQYLWKELVPNQTNKQIEKFIEFSIYDSDKKIYNSLIQKALVTHYNNYTFDGEILTLEHYKRTYLSNQNSSFTSLFNEYLAKQYQSDVEIAGKTNQIVNSDMDITYEQLVEIIELVPNKEISFVALQKFIAQFLSSKKAAEWNKAINTIESVKNKFKKKNVQKVDDLIQLISNKMKQSNLLEPIKSLNTNDNDLKFFFSKDKTHCAVIPVENGGYVKNFHYENKVWKNASQKNEFRYMTQDFNRYAYFYHQKSNENEIERIEIVNRFYTNELGNPKVIDDFYVSRDLGVALFVSTSEIQRENKDDNEIEYASFGAVSPKLTLQERQDNSKYITNKFHGKQYGNGNTDIYYSKLINNIWTAPKLLLNINTPFSERSPVLSSDGTQLYFASEGHCGLGGLDIFSVNVSVTTNSVKVLSEPKNMTATNSCFDDLYYQENGSVFYLSSNRKNKGADFDIYKVGKERTIKKDKKPDGIYSFDGLIFTRRCDTIPKSLTSIGNFITVSGKIVREDSTFFPYAKIIFYDDVGEVLADEIIFDKNGQQDSTYSIELEHNKKYKVSVFGYNSPTDSVVAYTQGAIDVCDNTNKDSRTRQDFKLLNVDKQSAPQSYPFFFKTGKFITNELTNKEFMLAYYKGFINQFKRNTGMRLFLHGYADERGTDDDNCALSRKRADSVRDFFIKNGLPSDKIIAVKMGEGKKFNGENLEAYKDILKDKSGERPESRKEIDWLLNRRVEIYFENNSTKHLKQHGCLE